MRSEKFTIFAPFLFGVKRFIFPMAKSLCTFREISTLNDPISITIPLKSAPCANFCGLSIRYQTIHYTFMFLRSLLHFLRIQQASNTLFMPLSTRLVSPQVHDEVSLEVMHIGHLVSGPVLSTNTTTLSL